MNTFHLLVGISDCRQYSPGVDNFCSSPTQVNAIPSMWEEDLGFNIFQLLKGTVSDSWR